MKNILSNNDFFELRRAIRNEVGVAPVVFKEDYTEMIELRMPYERCIVTTEITDFNSQDYLNGLSHYNKLEHPIVEEVKTHNFANNATWVYGSSNSLFDLEPIAGKVARVKRMKVVIEDDLSVSSNVHVCLWSSLASDCPAKVSGTRTLFGSETGDPRWVQLAHDGVQEVYKHLYMDETYTYPLYIVSEFKYTTINDLIVKSKIRYIGDKYHILFEYERDNIKNLVLRSSKNERLEIYTEGNNQLTGSSHQNPFASATFMVDMYDEW